MSMWIQLAVGIVVILGPIIGAAYFIIRSGWPSSSQFRAGSYGDHADLSHDARGPRGRSATGASEEIRALITPPAH